MSKNDITNDTLISKPNTRAFEENFDRIFGKKVVKACRDDGRCQYAIDMGLEGECHCPEGKCVMPDHVEQPPHTCRFCGAPSWCDPSDQSPPPDYCHESDHGEPD